MTERRPQAVTLAAKQRREVFVREYLSNGHSATKAAIAAGFSAKTAHSIGGRLLAEDGIKQAIAAAAQHVAEKVDLSTERTLRVAGAILHNDPRRFFREDGGLKPPSEWDDDMAQAVASVEAIPKILATEADDEQEPQGHGGSLSRKRKPKATLGYTYKIRFWNKNDAMDKVMRHQGLFEKDNEQRRENLILQVNLVGGDRVPGADVRPVDVVIQPNLIDGRGR